jgi:hypothetical protein
MLGGGQKFPRPAINLVTVSVPAYRVARSQRSSRALWRRGEAAYKFAYCSRGFWDAVMKRLTRTHVGAVVLLLTLTVSAGVKLALL